MNTKAVNRKWFYPAQDKIKSFLTEKFDDNYQCNFQDVCKEVVYENYVCRKTGEEPTYVQFIIHKHHSSKSTAPALIQTYWFKYDDTMQYFINI